ncbi:MAG: hypothetical protein H8E46_10805 [FCB group bacterium]|nr:hypothetical protein [FCB group bacterium]
MISCEQFETLYPFIETPEVVSHRENCPFCAEFNENFAGLKRTMASLPEYCTSAGFEARLHNRLFQTNSVSRSWNTVPRAAAFATGVAVVLIAGAIYHGVETNPGHQMADQPELDKVKWAEAESDSTVQDSTQIQKSSPWGDFSRIEAVSSQQ